MHYSGLHLSLCDVIQRPDKIILFFSLIFDPVSLAGIRTSIESTYDYVSPLNLHCWKESKLGTKAFLLGSFLFFFLIKLY